MDGLVYRCSSDCTRRTPTECAQTGSFVSAVFCRLAAIVARLGQIKYACKRLPALGLCALLPGGGGRRLVGGAPLAVAAEYTGPRQGASIQLACVYVRDQIRTKSG